MVIVKIKYWNLFLSNVILNALKIVSQIKLKILNLKLWRANVYWKTEKKEPQLYTITYT